VASTRSRMLATGAGQSVRAFAMSGQLPVSEGRMRSCRHAGNQRAAPSAVNMSK
jgi:hypothetical protein